MFAGPGFLQGQSLATILRVLCRFSRVVLLRRNSNWPPGGAQNDDGPEPSPVHHRSTQILVIFGELSRSGIALVRTQIYPTMPQY